MKQRNPMFPILTALSLIGLCLAGCRSTPPIDTVSAPEAVSPPRLIVLVVDHLGPEQAKRFSPLRELEKKGVIFSNAWTGSLIADPRVTLGQFLLELPLNQLPVPDAAWLSTRPVKFPATNETPSLFSSLEKLGSGRTKVVTSTASWLPRLFPSLETQDWVPEPPVPDYSAATWTAVNLTRLLEVTNSPDDAWQSLIFFVPTAVTDEAQESIGSLMYTLWQRFTALPDADNVAVLIVGAAGPWVSPATHFVKLKPTLEALHLDDKVKRLQGGRNLLFSLKQTDQVSMARFASLAKKLPGAREVLTKQGDAGGRSHYIRTWRSSAANNSDWLATRAQPLLDTFGSTHTADVIVLLDEQTFYRHEAATDTLGAQESDQRIYSLLISPNLRPGVCESPVNLRDLGAILRKILRLPTNGSGESSAEAIQAYFKNGR